MNKYLPSKSELIPVENKKNTFGECDFVVDFNNLSFQEKLQVINDIVRQSMIPSPFYEYKDHIENLKGDCHTATLASIEYLKSLGIGKNYRYVLATSRSFDMDDYISRHAVLLVDDDNGETYQYDASPFVGYKYGRVVKMSDDKLYQDYIDVTDGIHDLISRLESFSCMIKSNKFTHTNLKEYKDLIYCASSYHCLFGFVSLGFRQCSNYEDNQNDKDKDLELAIKYNKYCKINKDMYEVRKNKILSVIKKWEEEFYQTPEGSKKLEIAQNIVQELKYFDLMPELYLQLDDESIRLSHLTPRVLMEHGLTSVMIKPSAYFTNNQDYIMSQILNPHYNAYGTYITDLSKPTEFLGLRKMIYSHPCGEDYIRSMTGKSKIMLINRNANELHNIKKEIREKLGSNMYNKEIIWSDGEPILWHPFVTNYLHTADNPSESCLHYLINYPEHQLMTRYMYPNKKLEKELKR